MSSDFRDLERLAERLQRANQVLDELSDGLAEEAIHLVVQGWAKQSDPYGSQWAPRRSASTGGAILVRSGALRGSWSVQKTGRGGFRIAAAQSYATYHQNGTGRMAARMMVPKKGDIPARWKRVFDHVTRQILESELGP
ncbi:MAG: phage virion morphogenesis protein [Myxococcota bacterium]